VSAAAIVSLAGTIMFGSQFYGDVGVSPFGWSFALTIVGCIFFFVNGVVLIVHCVFIHMHVSRMHYQAVGRVPATISVGCVDACCLAF